ncbi:hypothetical protein M9H77_20882 [Catharanthus roseus]|uniref:Uncharacterized protein n=1 Tax=Catharanthus roseus TaxID=4058 RepID=A0ACC0AN12_CATRO|nr:hypothetical protein M9H77_20882 [Catharanthus roseus]
MRLAKLDELRQAARTGVEMRFIRERAELGSKVELRVQQAEANRMLILKAHRQKRASLKERTSQSLLRRMARESKYKERVRAAICQKRVAAERKRLGLLEAEKRKARARVQQVRKVAKSISHQREIERREMQNRLEDRLQRAKRQRAEYLMQRGRGPSSTRGNWNKIQEQADALSRKLARSWRQFASLKKTTLHLAKSYSALNINMNSVKSMPFEQLARLIESGSTLQTTKALLDRLENRYKLSRVFAPTPSPSWDDIDHLLRRVSSPKRRATPRRSAGSQESKKPVSTRQAPKAPVKLSRYQLRVVLCAYMVFCHPTSVFSDHGEREIALAESAETFIREFELLIKIILDGAIQSSNADSEDASRRRINFRSQLHVFDSAWCSYLNSFVIWKVKDAQSLEEDLVRAACQLELSMIQTCKMTPEGDSVNLTHDMKAIQKQVTEDQRLLRERVHHLSGNAGIERMESALYDTRMKYFQARETGGNPVGSPISLISAPPAVLPAAAYPSKANERSDLIKETHKSSHVARKLFGGEANPGEVGYSSQGHPSGKRVELENELIVNESLHGELLVLDNSPESTSEHQNKIKVKVKETMKKAFWDAILESVEHNKPNYIQICGLVREVRDEICAMAPESWKQEIFESIDLDILSQVLHSGNLDMGYLGKILEFSLTMLRKLSAPAEVDELKATHQKFLEDLSDICRVTDASRKSHIIALVRGLQFVLEQIQVLKEEVSKARIRLLEPLLNGPAGVDYLRKAFTKHYGSPDDALTNLPLTMQWLSSVSDGKDREWNEHKNTYSELVRRQENSSKRSIPPTMLKTGGSFSTGLSGPLASKPSSSSVTSSGMVVEYPECKGEKVDLLVRLGLLKMVFGISGLTEESLPETMKLNLLRLRLVQARIQKIIVIATSILVLRQTLLSEKIVSSHGGTENIISDSVKQLSGLLDTIEDAGISHITEVLGKLIGNGDNSIDSMKLQSVKDIMARMLTKSLQAGDTIFGRISHAIYSAVRSVLFGGTEVLGREMAEIALRPVGSTLLLDEVVGAASTLGVVATVSVNTHGPWYARLVDNM